MSDSAAPHYSPGQDSFPSPDILKHAQALTSAFDPFSSFYSPCDLVAPPPDTFEFDIDTGLEGFDDQLQFFNLDQNFAIPRGPAGPLSTVTNSAFSESASSEDIFSDISSLYSQQNPAAADTLDIFNQLGMGFQRVTVGSDYGAPQSKLLESCDPTSFGQLPPTPPRSPLTVERSINKSYHHIRSSFSDYGPPRRSSLSNDYFNHLDFTSMAPGTVSPVHIASKLPLVTAHHMSMEEDEKSNDPRKRYKCSNCTRAFARAYNLKTHMGTHDPNRLKPHVCHHRSCGRSFSRKHDLGRHLVSIHKDDSEPKDIGVSSAPRVWCDRCGKSSTGRQACDCVDDK